MNIKVKFKSSLLVVFLLGYGTLKSQTCSLVPFRSNVSGKYGYLENISRDTVVRAKYDDAFRFDNNIAAVKRNNLYGYINCKGEEITPFKYELTWGFTGGFWKVYAKSMFGLIDSTGREVMPLVYNYMDAFINGHCVVGKDFKYGIIDSHLNLVLDHKYDYLSYLMDNIYQAKLNGKIALVSLSGSPLTPFVYDKMLGIKCGHVLALKANQLIILDRNGEEKKFQFIERITNSNLQLITFNSKYGLIDNKGKHVTQIIYDHIGRFEEKLAPACVGCKKDATGNYTGGKWGFINLDGEEQIPLKYDIVYPFKYGRAEVFLDGQFYYIDVKNRLEIPIEKID